jgi:hypothetical protein
LAASVLTATMLTAIETVHAKNGPWLNRGGYEYNVVLIAAVLLLVEAGPRQFPSARPSKEALHAHALSCDPGRRRDKLAAAPPDASGRSRITLVATHGLGPSLSPVRAPGSRSE